LKPFKFKQFIVEQDRCAMKIGTDGILLGAWVALNNPFSILDIGAGTGIIALMLAQRSNAKLIDAIEIEESAYEQCVENFENSPWADRLFCYHASLDEFVEETGDEKYDLIISNPPFFVPNKKEAGLPENRKKARFQDSLSFEDLVAYASQLLTDAGEFAVIIPYSEEEKFIQTAQNYNLFPKYITRVRGTENSAIKRSLLQFSFAEKSVEVKELVLEISRHQYTDAFKKLVKDFYLKL